MRTKITKNKDAHKTCRALAACEVDSDYAENEEAVVDDYPEVMSQMSQVRAPIQLSQGEREPPQPAQQAAATSSPLER